MATWTSVSILVVLAVVAIFTLTRKGGAFRKGLLTTWRKALALGILYVAVMIISEPPGFSWSAFPGFVIFNALPLTLMGWYGLSFSTRIPGFRPFSVFETKETVKDPRAWWRFVKGTLFAFLLTAVVSIGASNILLAFGVKGPSNPAGVFQAFSGRSLFNVFLVLLGGAGLAEEITYRLLATTGITAGTRKPWIGIVLSGIIFGLYHLTPLDAFYLEFWNYPVYQAVTASLAGFALAWAYWRFGLEASILGHTLFNFIGLLMSAPK